MRLSRHALAVVLALGAIAPVAADNAKEEIRIGQTLPYSGPLSGFGIIGKAAIFSSDAGNMYEGSFAFRKLRSSVSVSWDPPAGTT